MNEALNNRAIQASSPILSPAQWQGLARLADWVNALSGPLAEPASGSITRFMNLATQHDLPEITESLVETLEALHHSGLLKVIAQNADLIAGSIQLLVPLIGTLTEQIDRQPWQQIKQDQQRLHELLDKVEILQTTMRQQFAGPAVRWSVDAVNFAQQETLGESIKDLLQTLGHLHRNGSLAWLRNTSDYLDRDTQAQLLAELTSPQVADRAAGIPAKARRLLQQLQAAVDDASQDTPNLGGIKGLIHLLRDPEVQRGLRVLAVLPGFLDGNTQPPKTHD
ncbi:MAG: DUF1641 domain-containing protein [Candidatus Thiodiazotropha sp.]